MDEPWKRKSKKPVTQDNTLYVSLHVKGPGQANLEKQKAESRVPRVGGQGRSGERLLTGTGFLSGGDENVLKSDSDESCTIL